MELVIDAVEQVTGHPIVMLQPILMVTN
jgi:hypothetical protein